MTTNRPEWHVADDHLADYASGRTTPVLTTSIDAHLMGCARCRDVLGRVGVEDERNAAWERLADSIDHPSPSLVERLTRRHRLARSVIATPMMGAAALAAIALVGLVPLAAALVVGDAALVTLLVLAPLAPVAAVTIAYRDWADPAGEIALATPSAGLRLVALRALVVSLTALPVAVLMLLVVDRWIADVPTSLAFAWCLPGLALAALVLLAGTTRIDPLQVAMTLSGLWAFAMVAGATARRSLRPEVLADVIASPALQTTALAVGIAALLLTAIRHDSVAYRRIA